MAGHIQPTGSYYYTTAMGGDYSRIEGKVYPAGMTPKGGQFSIRLNIVFNEWTGMARSDSIGRSK